MIHGHGFGGDPITTAAITMAVDIITAEAGIMDIEYCRASRISPLMGWTGSDDTAIH
jgi:hypothetical protein